jgi:hypothetical protein
MKLSEQIRSLQTHLNDFPASAENVRDQLSVLADQVVRLSEATEAILSYIYEQGTFIKL